MKYLFTSSSLDGVQARRVHGHVVLALYLLSAAANMAAAQSGSPTRGDPRLSIRAIAEVEVSALNGERETVKLARADRVVPGDQVIYTLEIRNKGAMSLPPPTVDYPIPEHMRYLDDTAAGPGADISYSIDGGHTFDRPENLKVIGPDGQKHPATAADYTHIRWQLRHILKGKSVAFARFRAVVR
ncbi:MAG: hypothetical protein ABSD02_05810 [Steroidobacteraceae bacterium]|jgi:uncharacterized repeat protein (TIGR01451 family)